MDISTGAWLIMSQPNALLILGDNLFLNYIFFFGQRGLINTAGIINPNLTLCSRFFFFSYGNPNVQRCSMGNSMKGGCSIARFDDTGGYIE